MHHNLCKTDFECRLAEGGAGNKQLMCYVCQPTLVGDSKSQEDALRVVTKLVQDFPGEKIGLCNQFNARNATFQKFCKDDRSVAVCLGISNGSQ